MEQLEKLRETLDLAQTMARNIQIIQKDLADYDLGRMLKKIEAEILDLQYNLTIAVRLMGGS